MRSYVGNEIYRERLVVGAVRVDLDGQPAGVVTAEQTPPYWKTEKPIDCWSMKSRLRRGGWGWVICGGLRSSAGRRHERKIAQQARVRDLRH